MYTLYLNIVFLCTHNAAHTTNRGSIYLYMLVVGCCEDRWYKMVDAIYIMNVVWCSECVKKITLYYIIYLFIATIQHSIENGVCCVACLVNVLIIMVGGNGCLLCLVIISCLCEVCGLLNMGFLMQIILIKMIFTHSHRAKQVD